MPAIVTATSEPAAAPRQRRVPCDIEALLVWVYRDQRADRVVASGAGLYAVEAERDGIAMHGGSNLSAIERICRLGCIVDQCGAGSGALHEDAEAVHRLVDRLDARVGHYRARDLLITYARMAARPDAMVGQVPRPVPVRTIRGAVQMEPNQRHPVLCPVVYEPSAYRILQAQAEWLAWHQGLRVLALALQGERLATWHVGATVAAPRAPWLDTGTKS